MEEKINVVSVASWIVIFSIIFILAWRILGNSPTIDQLVLIFTIFFLVLSFESRRDSKRSRKLNLLQFKLLKEIKDKL